MKFGLIGWPLGHSISPFIHQELFKLLSEEGRYTLYPTPPEELGAVLAKLAAELDGFNVTVPHKTAVLPYLEQVEESAALYGGANTLKCLPGGTLHGCNTDIIGVRKAMSGAGLSFRGRVCVLGSGATSGLLAMEAALQGCEVTVALRPDSMQRGQSLAARILEKTGRAVCLTPSDELAGAYDLLANGTIVGMYPNTEECPVTTEFLNGVGGVFDTVFNPSPTLLVRQAAGMGIPAAGGLPMLVWQAAAAQTFWHGKNFDPADVEAIIEKSRLFLEQHYMK